MPAKQLAPNKEPQYEPIESYIQQTDFDLDTQVRFDQRMIYNHPERYDAAQMSAMQDLCRMGCTNDALKQMAESGLSGEKMQAVVDGIDSEQWESSRGGFFERLFNKVDDTEMYQDLLQRAADPDVTPRAVFTMADIYTDPELTSAQKAICTQNGLDRRQMTALVQLQNPKTGNPLSLEATKQLADSKADASSMEAIGDAVRSFVIAENEISEFTKAAQTMEPAAVSALIEMSQNIDLTIADIDKMIEANADKMEIAYISRNCHSSTEVDTVMQSYNEEDVLGVKKSQYTDEQWDALKNAYTISQNPNNESAWPLANEQMDVLKDPNLSVSQIDYLADRGRTLLNPNGTIQHPGIGADDMQFIIDLNKQTNPEHDADKETVIMVVSSAWVEAGVPRDQIKLMAENTHGYEGITNWCAGKQIAALDASDVCTKKEVDAMVVNMTKNDGFTNPPEPSVEALEHMTPEMKTQIIGIYEHGSFADMRNAASALQALDNSERAKSMSAKQWDNVIQKTLDDGPDNPRDIEKDIRQEARPKTPAQAISRAINAAKAAPRAESKEAGIDTKDMSTEDENAGHKGFGE